MAQSSLQASTTRSRSNPRSRTSAASKTSPTVNQASLTYNAGIYDLVLRAGRRQRKALEQAEAEFALLLDEEPLVVLAFRFGKTVPWTLAPFVIPDSSSLNRFPPPEDGSDRALVSILLEDDDLDEPAGRPVRNLTLSLDFSRALNSAVRHRMHSHHHASDDLHALQRLQRRVPSVDGLVARASIRSTGSP